MKRRLALPAALLALTVLAWFLRGRLPGQGQDAPGVISGNGIVEATEVEVSARILGRIARLDVVRGGHVAAGEVIALMESGEIEGQVAQAGGLLAAAEAALRELEAGTRPEEIRRLEAQHEASRMVRRQAEARLALLRSGARPEQIGNLEAALRQTEISRDDAARELARLQRLYDEGALPLRDLDQVRTRRDLAVEQVEIARQRLAEAESGAREAELREAEAAVSAAASQVTSAGAVLDLAVAGARRETLDAARARVQQARGGLDIAERLLAETVIRSPIDGKVLLKSVEAGEVVTPGQPIVKLADLGSVWLTVYVPEPKIGLVKTGQKAEVTVDSYPGRTYEGVVTEIAEEPEFTPKNIQTREERVKMVFGVRVDVPNGDGDLKPGMPADASIHVGRR